MGDPIQSIIPKTPLPSQPPLVLGGFDWDQYLSIEEFFSERGVRVRFFENQLEIMAPVSETHEHRKSNIGCLIESWCLARGIRFFIRGNMTMTVENEAGGEADESYCFGEKKEISDLVIEIALTSGGLSKRAFYSKFPVPELWIWREEALHVFVWNPEKKSYDESPGSALLPGLDLTILAECAVIDSASDAILEFRKRCDL